MQLTKIGDYQLIKPLGQGSLGTVFIAQHRYLKNSVVIKILPEEFSDRLFVQRLEKEVALLASLTHPHIVKIHNVSFADGKYFLVTDCIVDDFGETTTMYQYLSSKGEDVPEEEIFSFAKQIASALDYAYPISHLGLKLNNVLIGQAKEGRHLYLSDFGLSKVVGAGTILNRTYAMVANLLNKGEESCGASDKMVRWHNTFLQNFAFLAPEQKLWNGHTTTEGKEDTYAFGVLVYYMLMRKIPEGIFERPSERYPHYKYQWDRLIDACLQESPKKRPEKLLKVLEEIEPQRAEFTTPKPLLQPSVIKRPEFEKDPGAIFQKDSTVTAYTVQPKEKDSIEPLLSEMAIIKEGHYFRGSEKGARDETPRHQIFLNSFAIDIHPVTNEQFVRFLEAMGGEKDGKNNDMIRLRDSRIKRSSGRLNIESGYAKHPVVGVSWYGALAYSRWVGKRLPTEAEWEIAACGGIDDLLFPTGDKIERSEANFFNSDTTAVMSYPPNGYGLFDVAGNVYEWCQDWYSYQYYEISVQEPDNPKGPLQGVYRILRGGCWKSLREDLRCTHRHRNNPGTMNATYGFRCATDVY